MTIWKVTVGYTWEPDGAPYSFGSLKGARKWIEKQISSGEVIWYSIEENTYLPCDESNPDGQLYIGCDHFEYHHKDEWLD